MTDHVPIVVIVGGGFAGLSAAQSLRNAPVNVIVIDRTNHHLFQPLLYQVATSVLSVGQVASPIRDVLSKQRNTTVILGEVVGIDREKKLIFANSTDRERVPVPYDYLILATGSTHNYFGHNEFAKHAPGLKGLADAVAIRNKVLQTFEQAEAEEDTSAHRDLLTFVLVGGGPAGVELAAAIATLVRGSLRSQFRRIDPTSARIVLLDRSKKLLHTYADGLSQGAKEQLERLGVEVRLGHDVDRVDENGVIVGGERIFSRTVIWTAGVTASPAGKWLNVETDRIGRVRVQPDLTVPGYPDIFVVGDTSTIDQDGKPLGGVAQVALQEGRYAARVILRRTAGKPAPGPFRYFDKGNMAVVGPGYAVLESGKLRLKGRLAWLVWAVVHIFFLAQPGLEISVFLRWVWTYLTRDTGTRLIVDHHASSIARENDIDLQAPLAVAVSREVQQEAAAP